MSSPPLRRAVFLDRDGVLNQAFVREGKSYPPDRLEDFRLLEGVAEACARLAAAGFLLIVVTNQPDVGTGKQKRETVEAMHERLRALLPLHDVLACCHRQDEGCACRKPRPGMLLEGARRHGVDLSASFMVGDRRGDIAAGQAAGCTCYFIDRQYREPGPEGAFETVTGLLDAADRILRASVPDPH